ARPARSPFPYATLFRSARAIWRGAVAATAGAALWIIAEPWTLAIARGDGRLHVIFIDVGQGDAIFVRLPHGSTLLVDAGGLAARSEEHTSELQSRVDLV